MVATLHASLTDKIAPLKVGCVLKHRTRKRLLSQAVTEGSQTAHQRWLQQLWHSLGD